MKITTSNENINSLGGLNFISSEFETMGMPSLITSVLVSRSILAIYKYSDIIKNIWMLFLGGGDCAEDIHTNLKQELSNVIAMKIPSADSILRLQKELSIAKEIHISKANITNEFSKHAKLNQLNLEILLKTKQLESGKSYDLDFDNQFIPCEKYDSRKFIK
jgi:hypothetical protein